MPKYILTYHGELADFSSDETDLAAINDAWGEFYAGIGNDLVDPGNPIARHPGAIGLDGNSCDVPYTGLTGFTVITAVDAAAAKGIAQGCPVLAFGSTVQVSELVEM